MRHVVLLLCSIAMVSMNSFAQLQWTKYSDFPSGGTVLDMASDNAGTIYVLTAYNSDIFYTTNNGVSWSQVPNTYSFWNIFEIEVDKATGTLYAGTSSEGIHWTSNKGQTWQHEYFYTTGQGQHASIMQVGLRHGANVIVAHEPGTMYISTNGGSSWTNNTIGSFQGAYDLQYMSNGDLLAGTENGVYKSTNNGSSWLPMNTGIQSMRVNSIAKKPNSSYLFAAVDLNISTYDSTGVGVFVSSNNGLSWTLSSTGITNRVAKCVIVDSATGTVYVATEGGVYSSANNGASWNPVNTGLQDLKTISIEKNSSAFFTGTSKTGVAYATQPSAGWTYRNNGILMHSFEAMTMTGSGDIYLLDGVAGGLYKRTAANASWQQQGAAQLPGWSGKLLKKDNAGNLYAVFAGIQPTLFKSINNGTTWTDLTANIPIPSTATDYNLLDVEIAGNGDIYILTYIQLTMVSGYNQLFRSTNGGTSFTGIIQSPVNNIIGFQDLTVTTNGHIYMTALTNQYTNDIVVSTDQGQTVNSLNLGSVNLGSFGSSFRILADRNDSLYIVVNTTIYKRNGIGNWSTLPNGGWPTTSGILLYFDNTSDIYVSSPGEGIYFSNTGGTTWTNMSAGLPTYNTIFGPIMLALVDLQFDSNDSAYARSVDDESEAAPYRGLYKLSGASIPNAISSINDGEERLSIYPNPTSGLINITLKTNTVQPFKVEVYDLTGRVVKSHVYQPVPSGPNTLTIDLRDIPRGVYMLHTTVEGLHTVQKLIKQ